MSAPEIVYSEFAVKCECGHIATFKNAHDTKETAAVCRGCRQVVSLRLLGYVAEVSE